MKRAGAIVLASLAALLVCELGLRALIGYPTLQVRYYQGEFPSGRDKPIYWFRPHSRYVDFENGLHIHRVNNIGLFGSDVDPVALPRVYVLGTSFIEARQSKPEMMASTVFQDLLRESGSTTQVFNLGRSNSSTLRSYFRLRFFSRIYPPDRVYLVMEDMRFRWMELDDKYDFSTPSDFGEPLQLSPGKRVISFLQAHSAVAYLLIDTWNLKRYTLQVQLAKLDRLARKITHRTIPRPFRGPCDRERLCLASILKIQDAVDGRLTVVDIQPMVADRAKVRTYCRDHGIDYVENDTIMRPVNRLHGEGHFNDKGNRELGKLLYEISLERGPTARE